jgi:glycosyltransferase involved in cell wall biosynthesis
MLVSGNVRPVAGDLPVGGAARQAVKLSRALRKTGVDASIVTVLPRLRFPRREIVDDVPVHYVNSLYWLLRRRGFRRVEVLLRVHALAAYLARHRRHYDIIHVHTAATATALAGVLAGRWLKKPTILKITNSGARYDLHRFNQISGLPWSRRLGRLLRSASCVVALNEEATDQLLADGFRTNQIVHIPNGVSIDSIQPRMNYDCNGTPNILYVGRLHAAKGLDTLLVALERIVRTREWHLFLVGSGPARAELVGQAKNLGLVDRITFAGEVADVGPYLQKADVFVLPSRTEGISNALLEAMTAGLPCVAADNAGNRRVLAHNDTGLLVRTGDIEALASAIDGVLTDAQKRERLGRAGRHSVETQFDIFRVAEAYLDVYQRLRRESSENE